MENDIKPLTPIPTTSISEKLRLTIYKKNDEINIDNFSYASVILDLTNIELNQVTDSSNYALLFEKFDQYSTRIGKIIRLSEIINYDLETTIRIYLQKNKLKDVVNRNSKCKELSNYENTYDFDFTKFKKLLSCIINSDPKFKVIEKLNSKEKIKIFTKTLHSYIVDRNYYTHGYLFIRIPSYEPLLSIVYQNSDHFIVITDKIIQDNLQTFIFLESIIKDINKVCSDLYNPLNIIDSGIRISK